MTLDADCFVAGMYLLLLHAAPIPSYADVGVYCCAYPLVLADVAKNESVK